MSRFEKHKIKKDGGSHTCVPTNLICLSNDSFVNFPEGKFSLV